MSLASKAGKAAGYLSYYVPKAIKKADDQLNKAARKAEKAQLYLEVKRIQYRRLRKQLKKLRTKNKKQKIHKKSKPYREHVIKPKPGTKGWMAYIRSKRNR